MTIEADKFKTDIAEAFIKLIDSKRGVAAKLAKSIGKPGGFITSIKRGKPVNALHLKAVGNVFGPYKVIELLSIGNNTAYGQEPIKKNDTINNMAMQLKDIEKVNPRILAQIESYLDVMHTTAPKMIGKGHIVFDKSGRPYQFGDEVVVTNPNHPLYGKTCTIAIIRNYNNNPKISLEDEYSGIFSSTPDDFVLKKDLKSKDNLNNV